ncbi:MAG TPA: hypothetical protein EYP20_01905 [Aigarchaeota archaeon]|nr:hypothetical protein [Aigarchaeota archaeon]
MEGALHIDVPIHITGFFQPYYTENPLTTGSVGAGLVLSPGVRVSVRAGDREATRLNGRPVGITPVSLVLKHFPPLEVDITSRLPPGVGFSVSASTTLGTALLAGRLTNIPPTKAAQLAHVAEVRAMTGLGDIPAIYSGGSLVVRTKPGAPGVGEVKQIPTPEKITVIAASLGRMDTEIMLTQYADKINHYGYRALIKFSENPSFENFLDTSEWFSNMVGFMTADIKNILRPVRSKLLGALVKKKALLAVTYADEAQDVFTYLSGVFESVYCFNVGDARWRMSLYQEPILGTSLS